MADSLPSSGCFGAALVSRLALCDPEPSGCGASTLPPIIFEMRLNIRNVDGGGCGGVAVPASESGPAAFAVGGVVVLGTSGAELDADVDPFNVCDDVDGWFFAGTGGACLLLLSAASLLAFSSSR